MPRDATAVAVPGFCCCSGPEAANASKEIGTKMPFFQVPSSGNDSAEMFKLQNPLFQHAFSRIPILQHSLELMLRVRDRVADRTSVAVTEFCVSEGIDDVRLVSGATAGECGLESKSDLLKVLSGGAVSGDDSACVVNFFVLGLMGAPTRRLLRLLVVLLLGARWTFLELLKDKVFLLFVSILRLLFSEPLDGFVRLRLPSWQQFQVTV